MNHAVFLGLLSGEPLFTNTFVLFSTPNVKTKPPKKSKTKQSPKQSNKNPETLQNVGIWYMEQLYVVHTFEKQGASSLFSPLQRERKIIKERNKRSRNFPVPFSHTCISQQCWTQHRAACTAGTASMCQNNKYSPQLIHSVTWGLLLSYWWKHSI